MVKKIAVFPPFALDYADECLWRSHERIALTPKAFALLRRLIESPGRLVSKDELLNAVWPEAFVGDAVIKVCIAEIRKALGDDSQQPRFIETVHRRGYRFIGVIEREESAEDSPAPAIAPATRYARSGGVNIAYQVCGDGPLDLVFVMGWVSHLEYFWTEPRFARFLRRLAVFSRVILFDKRGTGLSDRVPIEQLPTLEQRMDDVRAVMDAVGSKRAAICGVSEGGPMSALFAATHPAKSSALVMIGAYAKRLWSPDYPWAPKPEERAAFLQEIEERWGGPVGLEERAPSVADDPHFRDWWAAYLRMAASPSAALAMTRMNTEIDVRHVLPSIHVPTLVIHRSGDRCLKADEGRYVAAQIPGARFVELPGVDHLPFVGDQDAILDQIEEFLTGVRHSLEPDRVLATVLFVHCPDSGELRSPQLEQQLLNEIRWFRGRPLDAGACGPLAIFDGPARAVRCACAAAAHYERAQVAFRAALHAGECEIHEEGRVSGPAVEIAARIAKRAALGEILASGTVRDLSAGSGIDFRERGELVMDSFPHPLPILRIERNIGDLRTAAAR